jgi:cytochrome c553
MRDVNLRTRCLSALCAVSLLGPVAGLARAQDGSGVDAEVKRALEAKADPVRGKAEFEDCSPCHRKDAAGRANGSIPRLSGQHASVIVKQVIDIRNGRRVNSQMKPVLEDPTINAQVVADIAAYLQGLPIVGQIGKGPGTGLGRGKTLYDRDCAGCHGASGEGRAAKFFPMVAAQHYGYLLRELNMIRTGERGNSDPEMVKLIKPYSSDDLQAVADYMAQLPPPKR